MIVTKLQEHSQEIREEIKRLQLELKLNQDIIEELKDEDDEFSVELIQEETEELKPKKNNKNKKPARKESFKKARAWHLDSLKEKE